MRAVIVADSRIQPLNACVWTLGRALAYATATAVVAILVAAFVSGPDSERFATTGYLAALAAALILAVKWFLPTAPANDSRRAAGLWFPAAFTFATGVGALLLLGAGFASEPGSEVLAIGACFALIAAASFVRGGAVSALNARLLRGDRLSAARRYAVLAAIAALAVRAMFSSHTGEGFARLAYAAMIVAAAAAAASLIAPTAAGARLRLGFARAFDALRAPQGSRVFSRTAQYAAATLVAALILASLVPEPYAERFTTTAYLATLFAALGIGMTWLLGDRAPDGTPDAASIRWPKFALVVGTLLAVGGGLAFSPIAEALAVCVCLYVVGAAILKETTGQTNATA